MLEEQLLEEIAIYEVVDDVLIEREVEFVVFDDNFYDNMGMDIVF